MIPLNDLGRHSGRMSAVIQTAINRVLNRGWYVLGPEVESFEEEFASFIGVSYCITVANGTDALELALRAAGVMAGDAVYTVANAGMYGTAAILAIGAKPVFVDVDPVTMLVTRKHFEKALDYQRKGKAAIITHLYGQLATVEELVPFLQSEGIRVVEDCAQAHGAHNGSQMAGSFGDLAAFSFYPTKNLGALGDGGAVVTCDKGFAQHLRRIRQYGWDRKYHSVLEGGRNSRLDEIQAAVLRERLKELNGNNLLRRRIFNRYRKEIVNPRIRFLPDLGEKSVAHLAVAIVDGREGLVNCLKEGKIASDVHYPIPDYRQPSIKNNYPNVCLPVTDNLAESILTLPCFPEMESKEIDKVIDHCNGWC